ncbi:hypothetical protein D7V97_13990 [Corallococcus sp. CA053C]|uniref:hypothetical protein n=1 Tax=Corallococcus sp. CA053C TaxID=2316732 RepID=UPI000EA0DC61|nr:hypothetical protein [Corallococcus sp. CA053C]RKH10345.1 hypothetical protein D7V97_13990 [Corallococcus sp. CA053C]
MMDDTQAPPDSGPNRAKAAQDLSVPAILMLVMGGFWVLYSLYGMVGSAGSSAAQMDAINAALAQYPPDLQEKIRGMLGFVSSPSFRILGSLPGLILNGLVVFGAWKMKNLQSYGLAMTAAILSCIPCCGPCCGLGIIPGVWALVVLNRADVKAAFR